MKRKIRENPLWLMIIWFSIYLVGFWIAGHLFPPRYQIEMKWDHKIPFQEWFVLPYCSWFFYFTGMTLFYLKKDVNDYFLLVFVMMTGMSLCVLFYMFFPNCLTFRHPVENRNILCRLVNLLYKIDPPTNVFPSIHVGSSVAVWLVGLYSKDRRKKIGFQCINFLWMISICLSTMFIKQHSAADVIAGALLNVFLFVFFTVTKSGKKVVRYFE